MVTAQEIYESLMKDPNHFFLGEDMVKAEAFRRYRQHKNNEKALSMAFDSPAVAKLADFLQKWDEGGNPDNSDEELELKFLGAFQDLIDKGTIPNKYAQDRYDQLKDNLNRFRNQGQPYTTSIYSIDEALSALEDKPRSKRQQATVKWSAYRNDNIDKLYDTPEAASDVDENVDTDDLDRQMIADRKRLLAQQQADAELANPTSTPSSDSEADTSEYATDLEKRIFESRGAIQKYMDSIDVGDKFRQQWSSGGEGPERGGTVEDQVERLIAGQGTQHDMHLFDPATGQRHTTNIIRAAFDIDKVWSALNNAIRVSIPHSGKSFNDLSGRDQEIFSDVAKWNPDEETFDINSKLPDFSLSLPDVKSEWDKHSEVQAYEDVETKSDALTTDYPLDSANNMGWENFVEEFSKIVLSFAAKNRNRVSDWRKFTQKWYNYTDALQEKDPALDLAGWLNVDKKASSRTRSKLINDLFIPSINEWTDKYIEKKGNFSIEPSPEAEAGTERVRAEQKREFDNLVKKLRNTNTTDKDAAVNELHDLGEKHKPNGGGDEYVQQALDDLERIGVNDPNDPAGPANNPDMHNALKSKLGIPNEEETNEEQNVDDFPSGLIVPTADGNPAGSTITDSRTLQLYEEYPINKDDPDLKEKYELGDLNKAHFAFYTGITSRSKWKFHPPTNANPYLSPAAYKALSDVGLITGEKDDYEWGEGTSGLSQFMMNMYRFSMGNTTDTLRTGIVQWLADAYRAGNLSPAPITPQQLEAEHTTWHNVEKATEKAYGDGRHSVEEEWLNWVDEEQPVPQADETNDIIPPGAGMPAPENLWARFDDFATDWLPKDFNDEILLPRKVSTRGALGDTYDPFASRTEAGEGVEGISPDEVEAILEELRTNYKNLHKGYKGVPEFTTTAQRNKFNAFWLNKAILEEYLKPTAAVLHYDEVNDESINANPNNKWLTWVFGPDESNPNPPVSYPTNMPGGIRQDTFAYYQGFQALGESAVAPDGSPAFLNGLPNFSALPTFASRRGRAGSYFKNVGTDGVQMDTRVGTLAGLFASFGIKDASGAFSRLPWRNEITKAMAVQKYGRVWNDLHGPALAKYNQQYAEDIANGRKDIYTDFLDWLDSEHGLDIGDLDLPTIADIYKHGKYIDESNNIVDGNPFIRRRTPTDDGVPTDDDLVTDDGVPTDYDLGTDEGMPPGTIRGANSIVLVDSDAKQYFGKLFPPEGEAWNRQKQIMAGIIADRLQNIIEQVQIYTEQNSLPLLGTDNNYYMMVLGENENLWNFLNSNLYEAMVQTQNLPALPRDANGELAEIPLDVWEYLNITGQEGLLTPTSDGTFEAGDKLNNIFDEITGGLERGEITPAGMYYWEDNKDLFNGNTGGIDPENPRSIINPEEAGQWRFEKDEEPIETDNPLVRNPKEHNSEDKTPPTLIQNRNRKIHQLLLKTLGVGYENRQDDHALTVREEHMSNFGDAHMNPKQLDALNKRHHEVIVVPNQKAEDEENRKAAADQGQQEVDEDGEVDTTGMSEEELAELREKRLETFYEYYRDLEEHEYHDHSREAINRPVEDGGWDLDRINHEIRLLTTKKEERGRQTGQGGNEYLGNLEIKSLNPLVMDEELQDISEDEVIHQARQIVYIQSSIVQHQKIDKEAAEVLKAREAEMVKVAEAKGIPWKSRMLNDRRENEAQGYTDFGSRDWLERVTGTQMETMKRQASHRQAVRNAGSLRATGNNNYHPHVVAHYNNDGTFASFWNTQTNQPLDQWDLNFGEGRGYDDYYVHHGLDSDVVGAIREYKRLLDIRNNDPRKFSNLGNSSEGISPEERLAQLKDQYDNDPDFQEAKERMAIEPNLPTRKQNFYSQFGVNLDTEGNPMIRDKNFQKIAFLPNYIHPETGEHSSEEPPVFWDNMVDKKPVRGVYHPESKSWVNPHRIAELRRDFANNGPAHKRGGHFILDGHSFVGNDAQGNLNPSHPELSFAIPTKARTDELKKHSYNSHSYYVDHTGDGNVTILPLGISHNDNKSEKWDRPQTVNELLENHDTLNLQRSMRATPEEFYDTDGSPKSVVRMWPRGLAKAMQNMFLQLEQAINLGRHKDSALARRGYVPKPALSERGKANRYTTRALRYMMHPIDWTARDPLTPEEIGYKRLHGPIRQLRVQAQKYADESQLPIPLMSTMAWILTGGVHSQDRVARQLEEQFNQNRKIEGLVRRNIKGWRQGGRLLSDDYIAPGEELARHEDYATLQRHVNKSLGESVLAFQNAKEKKLYDQYHEHTQNALKYKEAQMQLKQLDPSVAVHWETINDMFNQHIVNTPNVFNDPSGSFEQPMYQPPKEPNPLV